MWPGSSVIGLLLLPSRKPLFRRRQDRARPGGRLRQPQGLERRGSRTLAGADPQLRSPRHERGIERQSSRAFGGFRLNYAMSVWGKMSGAAAGLPGRRTRRRAGRRGGRAFLFDQETDPGVAFTMAMIALAGKMAKADGIVTDQEFDLPPRVPRPAAGRKQCPAHLRSGAPGYRRVRSLCRTDARCSGAIPPCWKTFSMGCSRSPKAKTWCVRVKARSWRGWRKFSGSRPTNFAVSVPPFRAGTDRSLCDPGHFL